MTEEPSPGFDFTKAVLASLQRNVARQADEKSLVKSSTRVSASNYEHRFQEASLRSRVIENQILQEDVNRLKQQKFLRGSFFFWALAAITAVLATNICVMFWHMSATNGRPSDFVLVSWMTTTIVETIGIGYIIANYLFDGAAKNGSKAAKRSRPSRAK